MHIPSVDLTDPSLIFFLRHAHPTITGGKGAPASILPDGKSRRAGVSPGRKTALPFPRPHPSTYAESPARCNVAEYDLNDSRRKTAICSGRITVFFRIIASATSGTEANEVQRGTIRAYPGSARLGGAPPPPFLTTLKSGVTAQPPFHRNFPTPNPSSSTPAPAPPTN